MNESLNDNTLNCIFHIYFPIVPGAGGSFSSGPFSAFVIAFSRNERTHPNLVSQAREKSRFFGLLIGRPCRFLQGLWASFSCLSLTSCLLSFVASFVVFDFLGVSLKLTGF